MLVIFFLYFLLSVNLLFVYSKPYLYTDEDIILYLTRLKLGSQPSTTKPFNPVSLTSGSSLLPTDLGPKQNQDDLHVDQPSSHLLPICNPDLDDLQGIYCLTFINCYTNSYLILSKNLRNFFVKSDDNSVDTTLHSLLDPTSISCGLACSTTMLFVTTFFLYSLLYCFIYKVFLFYILKGPYYILIIFPILTSVIS